MNTATRLLWVLGLVGCAGAGVPAGVPAGAGTAAAPKPALEHRDPARSEGARAMPWVVGEWRGVSEEGDYSFVVEASAGRDVGPCRRPPGKLIERSSSRDLCPEVPGSDELTGPCLQEETSVRIEPSPEPCGKVRQVAVADDGISLAFASEREGLYLRTAKQEPLAPLAGFLVQHRGHVPDLIAPSSLLFFSEDRRSLFLVPLGRPSIVVDLARRAEVSPSPDQLAEIQRRTILKTRIRLLAKDDGLKEVGLRWALHLGDTSNLEAVARIARSTQNPTLRELANAIMAGYARSRGGD
jgi:hypothetical protein